MRTIPRPRSRSGPGSRRAPMPYDCSFKGVSSRTDDLLGTAPPLLPDTLRLPASFRTNLRTPLAFRQAISALHDVVVSDLRWKPKDRTAYLRWLSTQEQADLAEIAVRRKEAAERIRRIKAELQEL